MCEQVSVWLTVMAHMVSVLMDSVSVFRMGETAIRKQITMADDFADSANTTDREREGGRERDRPTDRERERGGGDRENLKPTQFTVTSEVKLKSPLIQNCQNLTLQLKIELALTLRLSSQPKYRQLFAIHT